MEEVYQKPKNLKEVMRERAAQEKEIVDILEDVETSMWDKCVFFDPYIKGRIYSGYVLPTCIYRVLAEVPIMLMLVKICLATRNWFERAPELAPIGKREV